MTAPSQVEALVERLRAKVEFRFGGWAWCANATPNASDVGEAADMLAALSTPAPAPTEAMAEAILRSVCSASDGPGHDDEMIAAPHAVTAMLAFAREHAAPPGWRTIDSAPRDGTFFDAWVPDAFGGKRMCGLSFNRKGQLRQHGLLAAAELPRWPTHWMPPPAAPTIDSAEVGE